MAYTRHGRPRKRSIDRQALAGRSVEEPALADSAVIERVLADQAATVAKLGLTIETGFVAGAVTLSSANAWHKHPPAVTVAVPNGKVLVFVGAYVHSTGAAQFVSPVVEGVVEELGGEPSPQRGITLEAFTGDVALATSAPHVFTRLRPGTYEITMYLRQNGSTFSSFQDRLIVAVPL